MTAANLLSGSRLAIAPLLLVVAWFDMPGLFLVGFAVALATDALDGFVARGLGQTSEFGARLDSRADLAIYLAVPLAAWWLWPEIVDRELPWIAAVIFSYMLPVLAGFLKFGALTSYHTWAAKTAVILLGPSALLLFVADMHLPFRVSAPIAVLSGVEELLITLVLPRWTADVPSLWHALHRRGKGRVS